MQTKGQINFSSSDNLDNKKLLTSLFQIDQPPPKEKEEIDTQDAVDEGHKDFIKEEVKEGEKNSQKLDSLINIAEFVLFKTKSANPFDFFPDEIIIDTNKISVVLRTFFISERVHSVMISDVSDVFIDTGFLFAKLSIVDKGFVENSVDVEFLKINEATKIRRIIQGLVVAKQQEIDFAKLKQEMSEEEIIEKIEKLGKARIGS